MVYDVYNQNAQAPDTAYPNFKLEHLALFSLSYTANTTATRGVL